MSHEQKTASGEVTDIFAHRFVVNAADGRLLADLTPKGAEQIRLCVGDHVELRGEMKPSELKVQTIARNGGKAVVIDPPGKPHHDHEHGPADPLPALRTVEANGFKVIGKPRRKPKHFEILGRTAGGELVELHVELGGALRKQRPVHEGDPKWEHELVV